MYVTRLVTEGMRQIDAWLKDAAKRCAEHNVAMLIFSDHGTCYGESGYTGHRLVHDAVTHVPYAELVIDAP